MAQYVDGFVLVVPKERLADYKKLAMKACKVWKKYGAIDFKECMADDLEPEMLQGTKPQFLKMTKLKPEETIVFSYVVFKSRKHRDQVNAKVMKDPFMNDPQMKENPMPFDMKRMAYGGFQVMVSM